MDNYTATEQAYKHGYKKGYADAKAEEKHGYWVLHTVGKGKIAWAECSECKVSGSSAWKRCPVCEAKMDLPRITERTTDALNKMSKVAHGGN